MQASLADNLERAVKQTLSMLNQFQPPKSCSRTVLSSVELGLEELRVGCKDLLEELRGRVDSHHAAAVTLLGLHDRFGIMLSFCSSGHVDDKGSRLFPGSLEASTKAALMLSMSDMDNYVNNLVKKKPNQQDVRGVSAAAKAAKTFADLLETLANETILLLAEVTDAQLSKDVTHSEVLSALRDLSDRCDKELMRGGIPDHVAVGTLLGIHARFRILTIICSEDYADEYVPDRVEVSMNASLVVSMAETKKCFTEYAAQQEMDADAADEAE
jgi:hypothetical protein